MTFDSILEGVKKYGATAVLVLWVLRQEARLNMVEDKLYNCYTSMQLLSASKRQHAEVKLGFYAILPNDIYTKRDIKRYVTA